MTVFNMPEGVEAGIKIYLTGIVQGEETDMVISVGGMPAFSDSCSKPVDVASLVKTYELDGIGHSWRVMTRAEIAEYKQSNKDDAAVEVEI